MMFADFFVLGMVFLALGAYVYAIKENTILEHKYVAADAKVMVESVQALPGNQVYEYSNRFMENYNFRYEDHKLIVERDKKEEVMYLAANKNYDYSFSFIPKAESFSILKAGGQVYVGNLKDDFIKSKLRRLNCPSADIQISSLALSADTKADKIFRDIEKDIDVAGLSHSRLLTVAPESEFKQKTELFKTSSTINLYLDQTPADELYAYVNIDSKTYNDDYAFACNILNELLEKFPEVKGASVVPVNTKFLSQDDSLTLLNIPQTMSIKFPPALQKNSLMSAQAVHNALSRYVYE